MREAAGAFLRSCISAAGPEHRLGDELLALGHDIGIVLGRWAFPQHGGGATKNDETVHGTLASPLSTFDTAIECATGLSFHVGLSNRREYIRAGQKFINLGAWCSEGLSGPIRNLGSA